MKKNALRAADAGGEKKETDRVSDQDVGGKVRVEKSAANAGNGLFLARDDH